MLAQKENNKAVSPNKSGKTSADIPKNERIEILEKSSFDDTDLDSSHFQETKESDDGKVILVKQHQVQEIIQMYSDNSLQPIKVRNTPKQIMLNNRCSRNHKLYNMSLIHKNKIILQPNKMAPTGSKEHFL